MTASDLVPYLQGAEEPDVGFHTGEVLAWDLEAGTNTIRVLGTSFQNLHVLAAGSVLISVGDQVAVWKFKSTYFVVGRIAPLNQTLQLRGTYTSAAVGTTSTTFGDLAGSTGPTLTDVYVGPSRRCLLLVRASISVADSNGIVDSTGVISVQVSGASSITPQWMEAAGAHVGTLDKSVIASACTMTVIAAGDGLNEGLNTFQLKYRSRNGQLCTFQDRNIAVIPM